MIANLFQFQAKKEARIRKEELNQFGVVLGDIQTDVIPNRFFICIIRGLLIFMASLGTIGGIASAFELPFNFLLVSLSLLIFSMYVAFLYYNRITFYIGYILLFVIFTFSAFLLYWYINSGYQAFWNCVFEQYSDYFHLSYYRESTEFITDRYITLSVTMAFIGFLYCILLNITISGYMNLTETFLLTFLPLQIPLYIDRIPQLPYLIMLLSVYIAVLILGRSTHFQLSYKQNKKQSFLCRRKKGEQQHSYLSSGISMLTISIYSVVFGTVFLLLTSVIFYSNFNGKYVSNVVKNTTDEYVKTYIQNGIFSFLNRYEATGGLSRGKLGGVSSITPDYETDLTVTFVPYSSDSIYLRAYTGMLYENNLFEHVYSDRYNDSYLPYVSQSSPLYGRMSVINMGADDVYNYYPYETFYTSLDAPGSPITGFTLDQATDNYTEAFTLLSVPATDIDSEEALSSYEVLYLPYQEQMSYAHNSSITQDYEDSVYACYLQVPQNSSSLLDTLDTICEDAGLLSLAEDAANAKTDNEQQAARLAIISALKRYFAVNYDYTMAPGTTPRDYDFVDYFLSVQKRGYCAHFAASSALILRRIGIPTRYVEGYMITMSDVLNATVIDSNTDGWIAGKLTMPDSGLVEVDVTDASAHAWIEVYLDGYGWIPVDMTPPSDDNVLAGNELLGLLSGFFTTAPRNNVTEENIEIVLPAQDGSSFSTTFGFILRPLVTLFVCLILLFLCIALLVQCKKQHQVKVLLRNKNYSAALVLEYRTMLLRLKRYMQLPYDHPAVSDVIACLQSFIAPDLAPDLASQLPSLERILQKAAFSNSQISQADYINYSSLLHSLSRSFRAASKNKGLSHK